MCPPNPTHKPQRGSGVPPLITPHAPLRSRPSPNQPFTPHTSHFPPPLPTSHSHFSLPSPLPLPTGLRPPAQGWPEARRPTLGTAHTNTQPQRGCVPKPVQHRKPHDSKAHVATQFNIHPYHESITPLHHPPSTPHQSYSSNLAPSSSFSLLTSPFLHGAIAGLVQPQGHWRARSSRRCSCSHLIASACTWMKSQITSSLMV